MKPKKTSLRQKSVEDKFKVTPSIKTIIASAALLASSNLSASAPVYTLKTGLGSVDIWDDTDTYYYLTGAALFSKALSQNSILDLQAEVSSYDYSDNDNVSSEEIFLQGSYSYTPTAGFRVPTYTVGLRYLEEFANEDEFDASTVTLLLSVFYRIDDRTSVLGGLKAGDRDTDTNTESDVSGYYVNFDFDYSPDLLFYTTLGVDEGAATIRSYCSGAYYGDSNSWNGWNGWNRKSRDLSGDCDNSYLVLGANYSFGSSNTIDVSASYNDYDTPVASFDGYIYSIDYFYRF